MINRVFRECCDRMKKGAGSEGSNSRSGSSRGIDNGPHQALVPLLDHDLAHVGRAV